MLSITDCGIIITILRSQQFFFNMDTTNPRSIRPQFSPSAAPLHPPIYKPGGGGEFNPNTLVIELPREMGGGFSTSHIEEAYGDGGVGDYTGD